MYTFSIKTLGCKVSQCDADNLAKHLTDLGLQMSENSPELCIVHGCSVTGRASQKTAQTIRSLKKRFPSSTVILSGCEALLAEKSGKSLQNADYILTETTKEAVKKMLDVFGIEATQNNTAPYHNGHTRAFLKIQDGCSQFCSYCIVCRIRGKERSKAISEVCDEARQLTKQGFKEIVLTGIHLGHYEPSLPELLRKLEKIEGIARIRLGSVESLETTDELIELAQSSKKICHHFHMPLQSGCDRILKAMNRPYKAVDYLDTVNKIRNAMPNASIGTDLITGFPGETDEEHQETLAFLEKIGFARIHIFRYSKRSGTPAAEMPDQVPEDIKIRRSGEIEKLRDKLVLEAYKGYENKQLRVIWETLEDGYYCGLSDEYIPCKVLAPQKNLSGSITLVKALQAEPDGLIVELQS